MAKDIIDRIATDNRTVAELTQPVDSELRAWQRLKQMEREYNEKHTSKEVSK